MSEIRLDTTELDRLARALSLNRDQMVRKIAFEVEGVAKTLAAVDTAAMRNSIYTVTPNEDGYGAASAAAQAANPKAATAPHPAPGVGRAHVGPCVEYAEYVELGTSRMAAQPFLVPAVEQVGQAYNDGSKWQELVK
jgi:HK97 gp10 family phage protein